MNIGTRRFPANSREHGAFLANAAELTTLYGRGSTAELLRPNNNHLKIAGLGTEFALLRLACTVPEALWGLLYELKNS